jgi:hypothetical protein
MIETDIHPISRTPLKKVFPVACFFCNWPGKKKVEQKEGNQEGLLEG